MMNDDERSVMEQGPRVSRSGQMPEPTVGSWRQFPHSPDKEKTVGCVALRLRAGLMPWGVFRLLFNAGNVS
jgi:hypothetical protein